MLASGDGISSLSTTSTYLANEQIPVAAADLLQDFPRKVYFFPETGQVWVKRIVTIKNDTIFEREREYRTRVKYEVASGSVDLFEE